MGNNRAPGEGESVGGRIRRLRLERGLSQAKLAEPGVSHGYISRIEAGDRQPSFAVLRKLARTFAVSVLYLETGSETPTEEDRELRLSDAELELRLAKEPGGAENTLRELLEEATEAGDAGAATRARSALGLAALRRGDHRAAIEHLEVAVTSPRVTPLSHPDVYGTLGRSYVSAGTPVKAVDLFERCLDELEETAPESSAVYVRFGTYLSYALSDIGEFAHAHEVVSKALERAGDVVDPYTRVRLYWSQARLSAAQGDTQDALANLRRAIALLEATEDTRHLGRAHLLCAEILTFGGEAKDAGSHLDLAERLLGSRPDAEDLYWLRAEQARRAAQLGDADQAVARAREALALIGDTDPATQGTAYWALAEGLARKGDAEAADDAFQQAVELLTEQRVWREAAKVCQSWARMLRQTGRASEAFDLLEQAADLAGRGAAGVARLAR